MMMKKAMLFFILTGALLCWVFLRKEVQEVPSVEVAISGGAASVSAADRKVRQAALGAPEAFNAEFVERSDGAPVPLTVPTNRPKQLSERKRLVREKVQKEPVAAESLYFWKDYESLREEEIRNPDSKENRAGVAALMKARQRRAGQN